MKLIDRITNLFKPTDLKTEIEEVVNTTIQQRSNVNLVKQTTERHVIRRDNDLFRYKQAVTRAESVQRPRRDTLMDLYKEVIDDGHLSSIMDNRIQQIQSTDFNIVNEAGERNPELERVMKQQWFDTFLKFAIESKFYGTSLIQFSPSDDEFFKTELVDRRNVIPEQTTVLKDTFSDEGINYKAGRFKRWVLDIGETKDLGLLLKASPLVLMKKNTMQAWSQYADRFGMPISLLKTNVTEQDSKQEMVKFLRDMSKASYAIVGLEDELQLVDADKRDVSEVYNQFLERMNSELSKLILNNTMTVDNGSSRSQSEVHERTQSMQTKSDLKWLGYIINNRLIPLLELHGLDFSGWKFEWSTVEKLSNIEQIKIDAILFQWYNIPEDYILEKYNVPTEGFRELTQGNSGESINEVSGGNEDDPAPNA